MYLNPVRVSLKRKPSVSAMVLSIFEDTVDAHIATGFNEMTKIIIKGLVRLDFILFM